MILAEQLLLIWTDDDSGRTPAMGRDVALAGALLIDLVRTGAVVDEDGTLAARGADPEHPLLAEARERIASSSKRRSARKWLEPLARGLRPLRKRVAASLVERGVLTEKRRKLLGVVPATRYPEADPAPERELRARLESILVQGAEPTDQESCLIALLMACGLVRNLVPRSQRVAAAKRAKDVADKGVASDAARQAIAAAQDGVNAALAGGLARAIP